MDQQQGSARPASEEVVNALPRITIEAAKAQDEQECPVCKDEFPVGQIVLVLPCKHIFHEECIKEWLKRNNTCPVCRFAVDGSSASSGGGGGAPQGSNANENNNEEDDDDEVQSFVPEPID